jgi:hypothetical protein
MSIILEAAIPPPHLLQARSASSWPSPPYYPRTWPVCRKALSLLKSFTICRPLGGIAPPFRPQSAIARFVPSPWLRDQLLIYGCLDQLRSIWPLPASTHVFHQSVTTDTYFFILNKTSSFHCTYRSIKRYFSRYHLLARLSSTRLCTPIRRAPVRRKKCAASVNVSTEETNASDGSPS